MQKDILYLGSQSHARSRLLEFAQINYKLLTHSSDEQLTHTLNTFSEKVLAIAQHKMRTLVFPDRSTVTADYLFALTADTLMRNPQNDQILGKPTDREHAIQMLRMERGRFIDVVTGCCLEKFNYRQGVWESTDIEHWTTSASIEFHVDDDSMDRYLNAFPFVLQCSGAGVVEDHGLSYLKSIHGSYTAVMGLPLYELRQGLKKLGFEF